MLLFQFDEVMKTTMTHFGRGRRYPERLVTLSPMMTASRHWNRYCELMKEWAFNVLNENPLDESFPWMQNNARARADAAPEDRVPAHGNFQSV